MVTDKKVITIEAPNIQMMTIKINSTSPLIFHKWSEKAKKMIRDKVTGKAHKGRDARNPKQEYEESFYYNEQGEIAFPATCIKQAMVNSARSLDGVEMTRIRANVFIVGDKEGLVKVNYEDKDKIMREDMVRVNKGGTDIRWRGQLNNWSMTLPIKFNAGVFSAQQVINLLQYAGFSSGIGEWRPEKNGDFGTFEVKEINPK